MELEITVENLPLFGTCNLCTNEGIAKSLLLPYDHNGKTELYTEMLMQCFSIDISLIQLGDTKKVICNDCIPRLRDAAEFKVQVEASLKTLKEILERESKNIETSEKEVDKIKTESNDEDDYLNIFDEALKVEDDIPLADFAVKEEDSSEEKQPRTRSSKKIKPKNKMLKLKRKKSQNLADTEELLAAGLFPFKIKNSGYVCAICPEYSTSLDDIKNHVNDHTKTIIHIAFKKMMFSNSQRFFKKQNMLRCKICTSDISNYEELKEHLDNCTRMKMKKNFKWNHLPFKLEKDQLDCPVCKKKFLNFVNLNTHMNVHYPNYICESCGKAFASAARLRGHMRTHEIGSFPCRYCDAVFDRVTKRENHVSKEHKAGVRYACKRCNISLPSFYARQKHLAEIHNEELKRYKCSACPQSYITPGHLSSHVRRDHLNERNHKCDKCDLAFYTKNALKMHMIKHDGERIFSCHVCQKSYQRKKTLTEHLRIHNNDKRFICPVCGRAFTQKCTLKGHMKVHERKVDGPCADVKSELYIV